MGIRGQSFCKGIVAAAILASFFGGVRLADAQDLTPPPWRGDPGSTVQFWEFSSASALAPDGLPFSNPYGSPLLTPSNSAWVASAAGRNGIRTFLYPYGTLPRLIFNVPTDPNSLSTDIPEWWVQYTWHSPSTHYWPYINWFTTDPYHQVAMGSPVTIPLGGGWYHSLYTFEPRAYYFLFPPGRASSIHLFLDEDIYTSNQLSIDQVIIDTRISPETLNVSFWKQAAVGDSVLSGTRTITRLYPPTLASNGKLAFVAQLNGTNPWHVFNGTTYWQSGCGPGPYSTQAAVNFLGRVATVRPTDTGGFVSAGWSTWCLMAGATGAPPPANTLSYFDLPMMPSHLQTTIAFIGSFGFYQGVMTVAAGSGVVTPYFDTTRTVPSLGFASAVEDYDLDDNMTRGLFTTYTTSGLRAVVKAGVTPGTEQVIASQNSPTGIGSTTWTSFYSPTINLSGSTVVCAVSNGPTTQDHFILVDGQIAVKEGDILDYVALENYSPVDIDLNNLGQCVHTWRSTVTGHEILFVGDINDLSASRRLIDTRHNLNYELSPTPILNLEGHVTMDDNLNIQTLGTMPGGVDTILRTTKTCIVDMNGDGAVDVGDYSLLSSAYTKFVYQYGYDNRCDVDFDAAIGIGDYAMLSSAYGMFCP